MFELATDFSKRTIYPEILFIDPKWDYEESQKQATRYIKTLICRNIEIPNKEPNMGYDGLEWKINPTVIKQMLYIINNIDVRHWKTILYSSLRNVGVFTWEEAIYGEYNLILSEKSDVSDDERILFSDLDIIINTDTMNPSCMHIYISFVVTNQITKESKIKEFYNTANFINYYNNITKIKETFNYENK